jgi:hypothetical protein
MKINLIRFNLFLCLINLLLPYQDNEIFAIFLNPYSVEILRIKITCAIPPLARTGFLFMRFQYRFSIIIFSGKLNNSRMAAISSYINSGNPSLKTQIVTGPADL